MIASVSRALGSLALLLAAATTAPAATERAPVATPVAATPVADSADLDVAEARVTYDEGLDLLVFEQIVRGSAGKTLPRKRGGYDGAPVLAYVFPTELVPEDVGFAATKGTVALAITAHPDFDDTNLWDENGNRHTDDDGAVWHAHWIVLAPDRRVPGELSVKGREAEGDRGAQPPTAPDLPVLIDSPGFPVIMRDDTLLVVVPASRINHKTAFHFDAMTAYLQISTAPDSPLLGVYKVYDVLSGDMKMPFTVKRRAAAR